MSSKIRDRIVTGLIFGAIVLACVFGHPLLMTFFAIFAATVALFELNNAFTAVHFKIPTPPVFLGTVLTLFCAYFGGVSALILSYIISCASVLFYTCFEKKSEISHSRMVAGLFALTYIAFLTGFIVVVACQTSGPLKLILGFVVVSTSDIGGFVIGSQFGKRALAPEISPNKTVEGLVGSLVFALASSYIFVQIFFPQVLFSGKFWFPLVFAVGCVAIGTFGDLAESMLKRDANVKDIGTLLAGHGGMLDRVDSILMCSPFVFMMVTLFV